MDILCKENILLEFELSDVEIDTTINYINSHYDVSDLGWCDTMALFDDVYYSLFEESDS